MAATARAVDLTDVKEGGVFRPKRKPEGDYEAKIVKADDHESKDTSKPLGWVLTIQVKGDARSTYPYYLSPDKKSAWKIGVICRAAGLNVKNARIKFDPNKLVNKSIGVALADDEYEGRPKSTIDDVFPVSEVGPNADGDEDVDIQDDEEDIGDYGDEEPEEEEEVAPPPRKRAAARKPAPEPDPEEEDDEEEEPAPPPRRRTTPPTKRVASARKAPEPEPEEEDEDEEVDEEPPPPARRRRAATPPAKAAAPAARKRRAAPPPPDEDDDLDELETDDLDE